MSQDGSPFGDFEARLAALKDKMLAGLPDRAVAFEEVAQELRAEDEEGRKKARRLAHKLAGIAGSYGFQDLTDQARDTEWRIDHGASAQEIKGCLLSLADVCRSLAAGKEPTIPPPATSLPQDLRRRTVLALEDDESTAHLLSLTLGRIGGFEALVVDSAEKALDLLGERSFELILVDAMMPGMNGREFCTIIRRDYPQYASVPLVILSAASPSDLGWDLEADAYAPDGWLRKPIRPKSLILELAPFLSGRNPAGEA